MYLTLALRNMIRNPTRSLLTLSAISSGCVALILAGGFIEDTLKQAQEAYIQDFLGHLRIYKTGFMEKGLAQPFDYMISDPTALIARLEKVPHVNICAPRLPFAGLISTGETSLSFLGEGLDPARETRLRDHLKMETGEFLKPDAAYDILLGKGLARALSQAVGSSVILVANTERGAINAADASVSGVFGTADKAYDDHVARLPLSLAQSLLRTSNVQTLVLYLDDTRYTDTVRREVESILRQEHLDYEIKPWYALEEADTLHKMKAFYRRMLLVLKILLLFVVTLGVANTMNMAVLERIGEIGTLRALGTRRAGVLKLFLIEGWMLGLVGGILGCLLGPLLALLLSHIGIPMPSPPGSTIQWTARIAIVPESLLSAFGLALVTAMISSVFPAYKASRLDVAEALRHNL